MTDNLNSIIREIKENQKTTEDLKAFLEKKTAITVDDSTFAPALQTTKEAIVHTILLHFIQNSGEQSLEDVIGHLEKAIGRRIYAKNNPIRNPNKEFCAHLNFRGEEGNTLFTAIKLRKKC